MHLKSIVTVVLGTSLFLTACLVDREAKRGSVVDNETRVGFLYLADGNPAVNARVRVFPVSHVPDSSAGAFSTRTDAEGKYVVDPLVAGEYNVMGDLSGAVSYQDSIYISPSLDTLPSDTLDAPGSLAGAVGLQPNHDPITVTVELLGTNIFANVDEQGTFRLEGLAGGKYSARLTTTLPDYTPLYVAFTVRTGHDDTLPDTLRLPFSGIPVVEGLRAAYDTARSLVLLSWNPVKYRNFSEYLVFRDSANGLIPSQTPIALVRDSAFTDSLALPSRTGLFLPGFADDHELEYRVKVRNLTGRTGESFGFVQVKAVSQSAVKSSADFAVNQVRWDSRSGSDSIELVATFSNPTRGQVEVTWEVGDGTEPLSYTHNLMGTREERDTLRYAWSGVGAYTVRIAVKDVNGDIWEDSLRIPGNSAPVISGSPATRILTQSRYEFIPEAMDLDGDNLRFSVANPPGWAQFDSSTGKLSGTPGDGDVGSHPGISIRVFDGRRSDTLPAFALTVVGNPWKARGPMLSKGFAIATMTTDSGIYLVHQDGDSRQYIDLYDPRKDTWKRAGEVPDSLIIQGGAFFQGRIFVIARKKPEAKPATLYSITFDPANGGWEIQDTLPENEGRWSSFYLLNCLVWKDMIFIFAQRGFGGSATEVLAYRPAQHAWTVGTPSRVGNPASAGMAALGDRVYMFGDGVSLSYNPETDAWSYLPMMNVDRTDQALCASGGKLFSAGGWGAHTSASGISAALEEFDPARTGAAAWVVKPKLPTPRAHQACSEWEGKIYFFGGKVKDTSLGNPNSGSVLTDIVEEYTPSLDP